MAFLFFLFGLIGARAQNSTVSLAWDPDTDSNVTGYLIYYGTSSGNYTQPVSAGLSSTGTLSNLSPGTIYFSVVTACYGNGLQSPPSNEISFTAPTPSPQVALVSPNNGATLPSPATIVLTAMATDPGSPIAGVNFYNGATCLGVVSNPPYTFTWNNVRAGQYNFTAVAVDGAGLTAVSSTVSVTVSSVGLPYTTSLIVKTRESVPGIPKATFSSLGNPALNALGHCAFQAIMAGVPAAQDSSVWSQIGAAGLGLVVQTGQPAPGTASAVFSSFGDPVYNNVDAVAFRATVKGGDTVTTGAGNNSFGIWSNDDGSVQLVARAAGVAPGTGGGVFQTFTDLALADQGGVAILATLLAGSSSNPGPGGITTANNQGIWVGDNSGDLELAAQKGSIEPLTGRVITALAFLPCASYVSGQTRSYDQRTGNILYRATLSGGSYGIFGLSGTAAGYTQAVVKGAAAPDISGAEFEEFGNPALNSQSHIAFQAIITGVPAAQNSGIWADSGTNGLELVAQTQQPAPGTTGAQFASFSDPVYNNFDAVAFRATVKSGDTVTTGAGNNSFGIWANNGGSLQLVARAGGDAPGTDGAVFQSFLQFALPDQGGVVMLANLLIGAGGITAATDQGIWAVDDNGNLQLIAQKGTVDPVSGSMITSLVFLPAESYVSGQTRSFDQPTGNLLYKVTLRNGTSAIYNVDFQ